MPSRMNDWKGITGQFGGESMVNRLRDALVTNPVRVRLGLKLISP